MNLAATQLFNIPTATYAGTAAEDDSLALSADNGAWVEQDHDLEVEPVVAELQDTYHQPQLQETVGVTAQNAWTTPKVGLVAAGGILGGVLLGMGIGARLVARYIQPQINDLKDIINEQKRALTENGRKTNTREFGVVRAVGPVRVGPAVVEQPAQASASRVDSTDFTHVRVFIPDEAYAILQPGDRITFQCKGVEGQAIFDVVRFSFRRLVLKNVKSGSQIVVAGDKKSIIRLNLYVGKGGIKVVLEDGDMKGRVQRLTEEGKKRYDAGEPVDAQAVIDDSFASITSGQKRMGIRLVEELDNEKVKPHYKDIYFKPSSTKAEHKAPFDVFLRVKSREEGLEIFKELMTRIVNRYGDNPEYKEAIAGLTFQIINALAYEDAEHNVLPMVRAAQSFHALVTTEVVEEVVIKDFVRKGDGDEILVIAIHQSGALTQKRAEMLTTVLAKDFDLRELP